MKKHLQLLFSLVLFTVLSAAVLSAQTAAQAKDSTGDPQVVNTSATTPAPTTPSPTPQLQTRDPRYRIAPSDMFDLTFPLSPEYNQLGVTVQPDGFVTLYAVGDVKVQGLTVPQMTDTIRHAYESILHEPLISVVLKDFNKPYFVCDGQVGHPGKYDLRADTTLTEAIAIAGGLTEDAKHSKIVLFRRSGDQWVASQIFDVKKMEAKANLSEDPYLHPGDMIFVPKSGMGKIRAFLPGANIGTFAPLP